MFKSLFGKSKGNVQNTNTIDKGFVDNAVSFFDGYLSLCKRHSVMGSSTLSLQKREEGKIEALLSCTLFTIDAEDAAEAFRIMKRAFPDGYGWIKGCEEIMTSFFGTKALHWAYTDSDCIRIQDREVIITSETSLFTFAGANWESSVAAIKKQLSEKWPGACVEIGRSGLIVRE